MKRAVERFDVNVIGLTLSKNQHARAEALLGSIDSNRSREVRLQNWEDFSEPVDRIVSIEPSSTSATRTTTTSSSGPTTSCPTTAA